MSDTDQTPERGPETDNGPKTTAYNGEKGKFVAGNPGRPAGTPNKVTREFRDAVQRLLEHADDKLIAWLDAVANGTPGQPEGDVRPIAGDPAKALELVHKLAEYATPKLARSEHTGRDGSPIVFQTSSADKDL